MSEYLDRKQVIELYEKHHSHLATYVWEFGQELRQLPIVEERPHGEWLSHYEYCKKHDCIPSGLIAFWWCNKCEQAVEIPTNFCPNCGADMRVKDELNRVSKELNKELNSENEKSKSEIIPDYRDGWRLKEGEAE